MADEREFQIGDPVALRVRGQVEYGMIDALAGKAGLMQVATIRCTDGRMYERYVAALGPVPPERYASVMRTLEWANFTVDLVPLDKLIVEAIGMLATREPGPDESSAQSYTYIEAVIDLVMRLGGILPHRRWEVADLLGLPAERIDAIDVAPEKPADEPPPHILVETADSFDGERAAIDVKELVARAVQSLLYRAIPTPQGMAPIPGPAAPREFDVAATDGKTTLVRVRYPNSKMRIFQVRVTEKSLT